jgi:capsular polysaccharide export protein
MEISKSQSGKRLSDECGSVSGKPLVKFGRKVRPRVLLLQGPVGTFFNHVQQALDDLGYDAWAVNFNAADSLFGRGFRRIGFYGGLEKWKLRLSRSLALRDFDAIILFGSERPAHRIARDLAREFDIPLLSLEEGYVRPGYITAEWGGNNASSPLAGCSPARDCVLDNIPDPAAFKSFGSMGATAFFYFSVRTLFTFGRRRAFFHRPISPAYEIFCWWRNAFRRLVWQQRNFAIIETLLEHHDHDFFLVPLQVAADSNMQEAAMGWDSKRLIEEVLVSFASRASGSSRLVFKVHPLERGHQRYDPMIFSLAERLRVRDRVSVIDVGSMGLLARHAAGMITINSTSGLSAIYHGTPLLVLGRAVYASPEVATCAMGKPDFCSFWNAGFVASPAVRQRFLAWIRQEALLPGDFYSSAGKRIASKAVAERLNKSLESLWRVAEVSDESPASSSVAVSVSSQPCLLGGSHIA